LLGFVGLFFFIRDSPGAAAPPPPRPWAVDTARGVESSPGIKDPDRMRRFIRNAKDAS
jgi:phosphoribosylanthranilate isomerase